MQNIFTIPASRPFQETLAKQLMGEYGQDPLFFSNITIFLPNRRTSFNEIILVNGNNTDFLLYNKQIHYE